MAEYIERDAFGKAYMDLCLAKSKLAKSRKGAAFFQSELLPETEPTVKELFRLVMSLPAADVVSVVRCKDCKLCKTIFPEKEIGKEPRQAWICMLFKCERKPNDFCSYGERRESNGRS